MQNFPVIVEAVFKTTSAEVWKALTDNEEMKKWYFNLEEFKAEPGFQFQFEGGTETKTYTHLCEITEVIPGKKLSYTWKYKGYPGLSTVTFELFSNTDQVHLKLTHKGLETSPPLPDFAKENFKNGWTAIIGSNLKNFLEKDR